MLITSSSSSSVCQSTVASSTANHQTSTIPEEQSTLNEGTVHPDLQPDVFVNQNPLDQTHVMDSSDAMEETDCVNNIFANAGHTGRIPPIETLRQTKTVLREVGNDMDITHAAISLPNAQSKIEGPNRTSNFHSSMDITLAASNKITTTSTPTPIEDTFSNLFASAGIKKLDNILENVPAIQIASANTDNMELTCQLPFIKSDVEQEKISQDTSVDMKKLIVNYGETCSGMTPNEHKTYSTNSPMEMTCQLPLPSIGKASENVQMIENASGYTDNMEITCQVPICNPVNEEKTDECTSVATEISLNEGEPWPDRTSNAHTTVSTNSSVEILPGLIRTSNLCLRSVSKTIENVPIIGNALEYTDDMVIACQMPISKTVNEEEKLAECTSVVPKKSIINEGEARPDIKSNEPKTVSTNSPMEMSSNLYLGSIGRTIENVPIIGDASEYTDNMEITCQVPICKTVNEEKTDECTSVATEKSVNDGEARPGITSKAPRTVSTNNPMETTGNLSLQSIGKTIENVPIIGNASEYTDNMEITCQVAICKTANEEKTDKCTSVATEKSVNDGEARPGITSKAPKTVSRNSPTETTSNLSLRSIGKTIENIPIIGNASEYTDNIEITCELPISKPVNEQEKMDECTSVAKEESVINDGEAWPDITAKATKIISTYWQVTENDSAYVDNMEITCQVPFSKTENEQENLDEGAPIATKKLNMNDGETRPDVTTEASMTVCTNSPREIACELPSNITPTVIANIQNHPVTEDVLVEEKISIFELLLKKQTKADVVHSRYKLIDCNYSVL